MSGRDIVEVDAEVVTDASDIDSDTDSDTDSNTGEFTVITTATGETINIEPGSERTVIHAPGLQNIQIGNGRCVFLEPSRHPRPDRSPRRPHRPTSTHVPKLSDSTLPPSKADLRFICENIGRRWKKLATGFGFSRGQVDSIEVDFHIEGNYEMAWQTLLKWRRQNGDSARICDLVRVLHNVGLTELAQEIPVN